MDQSITALLSLADRGCVPGLTITVAVARSRLTAGFWCRLVAVAKRVFAHANSFAGSSAAALLAGTALVFWVSTLWSVGTDTECTTDIAAFARVDAPTVTAVPVNTLARGALSRT